MSKRTAKPLTEAEGRVLKDYEAGELRSVSPRRTARQRYQQAARATLKDRRLNIRLQQLADRYESDDKYRKDAFIHTLMGIIYDADAEVAAISGGRTS